MTSQPHPLPHVRVTGTKRFVETAHPTRFGDVDMRSVLLALQETMYLQGLREGLRPASTQ